MTKEENAIYAFQKMVNVRRVIIAVRIILLEGDKNEGQRTASLLVFKQLFTVTIIGYGRVYIIHKFP